jgi:AraC-like DNA-binding protein
LQKRDTSTTLGRMTTRKPAAPPRGVLRARVPAGESEHRRLSPQAALAPFVEHFWWVRWSLPAPATAETLPHPSVHVVFERSAGTTRAEVAGVSTARFTKTLSGDGWAFGIKFRPAAFQPWLRASMSTLAERVVPISTVFGAAGDDLAREVLSVDDFEAKIAVGEAFLVPRIPPLSLDVASLRDLVERLATDRSLLRVEDAAALVGVDVRTLQRRFRRYVGASPKWVLQRYRLHEAAERLKGPVPPSLADLAAELGYTDQAHFTGDFTRVIGRSPARFAAMEGAR